jgi:alpha/beta superfamily hydrolase
LPEVIFNGPEGRLEGRYQHGAGDGPPIALVLHPHPQHGGSMNNKVVYTLFHAFAELGFSVLRFNFRGVGRSQGGYDQGQGELGDAASALDWLQSYNPDAPSCWVGGFSFGAWIALQLLMRRPELDGFIAVAPPAGVYDFSFLAPCPVSGQVIQGAADEVVPVELVTKLVHRLSSQRNVEIDFRVVDGANHFFNGELAVVTQSVKDYVSGRIAADAP